MTDSNLDGVRYIVLYRWSASRRDHQYRMEFWANPTTDADTTPGWTKILYYEYCGNKRTIRRVARALAALRPNIAVLDRLDVGSGPARRPGGTL